MFRSIRTLSIAYISSVLVLYLLLTRLHRWCPRNAPVSFTVTNRPSTTSPRVLPLFSTQTRPGWLPAPPPSRRLAPVSGIDTPGDVARYPRRRYRPIPFTRRQRQAPVAIVAGTLRHTRTRAQPCATALAHRSRSVLLTARAPIRVR